jgi:hydroxymethylbilane synthase
MARTTGGSAAIKLRLGTRSSLLAIAQSRLVAEQLQDIHPQLEIELVELQSQGDRDLKTPLSDVRATNFFSDELDAALAAGEVDFCVHSWKDIDGPRPESFVRAAVPSRAMPHDVILFSPDIMQSLQQGKDIRIGTSSLRRKTNTADFLNWALPDCGRKVSVAFEALRGPVHERVKRIHSDAGDQQLDGVVLALAGLQRLWQCDASREAIQSFLTDARWMVMPLSEAPAAPAQGALALETLRSNTRCRELLRAIHDPDSEAMVAIEQRMVEEVAASLIDSEADSEAATAGFGATAVPDPILGYVARLRGRHTDKSAPLHRCQTAAMTETPLNSQVRAQPWPEASWRSATNKTALDIGTLNAAAIFIAHADAWTVKQTDTQGRCWTSGIHSWKQLASQGLWVEGCADNLGFDSVKSLLNTPVLQLPPLSAWTALTHRDAVESWSDSGMGKVIASYAIDVDLDPLETADELSNCTHFFWSSARQYRMLQEWLPPQAHHACGTGKTYQALLAAGADNLRPFTSRREWQQWLD